jgi:hypothetical protein
MGALLTSVATKDSRTDHWPDSEGSVEGTWEWSCLARVREGGVKKGSWNGKSGQTYGYEGHAAQDAEYDDDPTAAKEDEEGNLLLEVELGFPDYLEVL